MSANTGAEMAIQMPTFTLASLLTKLMKDAGLTQQELAAKAEVHVGTVGKILRGETRDPEMATLSKIAGALGKTPLDLDLMLDTYNNASAGRIVQMPPQPPAPSLHQRAATVGSENFPIGREISPNATTR
jgi:transcriptional regulator with XRE-family HTH domain